MEATTDRPEYTMAEAAESLAREAGVTIAGFVLPAGAPMIHALIIAAMRKIGAVEKSSEFNEGGTHFKYRSVDSVVNEARKALAEVGIYPRPVVREVAREWGATRGGAPRRDQIVRVTYEFTAPDGSHVDVILEHENWSTSDKGTGAALSALLRIALCQLFLIPTGDPDPDASYPETGTAPRLSKPLAQYILAGVHRAPVERLEELWRLLVAHTPGDSRIHEDVEPGQEGSGRVWWHPFAERYIGEVDACKGKDDLAALWKRLGEFGLGFLTGNGITVADRITQRGKKLVADHQAAMTEIRDLLAEATDAAMVDHAVEVIREHLTNGRINGNDSLAWLERADKIRTEIRDAESNAAREAFTGDPDADPADLPSHEGR
jgi:ERF superfamily protein